jgi:glycerophosphoryl diester phosphodiesterase
MSTYDRRTFLGRSALLAAAAATGSRLSGAATPSSAAHAPQAAEHPFFAHAGKSPEVIAHRGGNGQWPGETMYAFRNAAAAGSDVLEMDVYLSSDGKLVLMHNDRAEVTTEGSGYVNDLSSAFMQTLNAGHKWSGDGGKSHPYEDKRLVVPDILRDLRVPLLKDVFETFPDKRMNIEMKRARVSPVPALCSLIREHGVADKVLVASFDGGLMREFRRLCPEVATSASLTLEDVGRFLAGRGLLADGTPAPLAIQVPHRLVNDGLVRRARQRNLKVHAWTVNDLVDMSLMKTLRVDGIITDFPGPLLALLERV